MKRWSLFLLLIAIFIVLLDSPSFPDEVTTLSEPSPWSWVYGGISKSPGVLEFIYPHNEEVDLFLISMHSANRDIPEIWQMGLSVRNREYLTMGFSWSGGLADIEETGSRQGETHEIRIPWGTYSALAWRESMEVPHAFHWNVLYRPKDDLVAEAGLSFTRWSSYGSGDTISFSPEGDLQDTLGLHFGLTYSLSQTMNVQAGYIFDPSPAQEGVSFRGSAPYDRHILRFGTGFRRGDLDMSLSYMFMLYEQNGIQTGSSASDPFVEEEDDNHLELKVQYRF